MSDRTYTARICGADRVLRGFDEANRLLAGDAEAKRWWFTLLRKGEDIPSGAIVEVAKLNWRQPKPTIEDPWAGRGGWLVNEQWLDDLSGDGADQEQDEERYQRLYDLHFRLSLEQSEALPDAGKVKAVAWFAEHESPVLLGRFEEIADGESECPIPLKEVCSLLACKVDTVKQYCHALAIDTQAITPLALAQIRDYRQAKKRRAHLKTGNRTRHGHPPNPKAPRK